MRKPIQAPKLSRNFNPWMVFLFMLFGFVSCKKENIPIFPPNIPVIAADLVQGSVYGIITNENQENLANVIVRIGSLETTSNEDGFWEFSNISIDRNGSYFSFEKEGYYKIGKFIRGFEGERSVSYVQLVKRLEIASFNSSVESTIVGEQDFKLTFPANSVALEGGDLYSGQVHVFADYIDPYGRNGSEQMPGDLRAVDNNNDLVDLISYGMVQVELEGDNGEALNIAEGMEVEIAFPFPLANMENAPNKIPLWWMDSNSGYWIEEGEATVQGNYYKGSVSHFTVWNIDIPGPTIEVCMQTVGPNNNPFGDVVVEVELESYSNTVFGYTNSQGNICFLLPQDEALTFNFYLPLPCGGDDPVYSLAAGPFGQNEDLGPILIDFDVQNLTPLSISGSVSDCDGNLVSSGFVKVSMDFNTDKYLDIESDGSFNGTVVLCPNYTTMDYFGYNGDNQYFGPTESVNVVGLDSIDLGLFSSCPSGVDSLFFNFNVMGVDFNLDSIFAHPQTSFIYLGGENITSSGTVKVNLTNLVSLDSNQEPIPGTYALSSSITIIENPAQGISVNGVEDSLFVEFIDISDEIGDVITGNIFGTVYNSSPGNEGDVPVTGSFIVQLSEL